MPYHYGEIPPVSTTPPDVIQAAYDYLSGFPTPGFEVTAHEAVIYVLGPDMERREIPDPDIWEVRTVWKDEEENEEEHHDRNRIGCVSAA